MEAVVLPEGEGRRAPRAGPRLMAVPLGLAAANALVVRWHRRHGPVAGYKFAIGCAVAGAEELCGVAIVGRPVSRGLDDGWTVEVLRLATDGTQNACSFLYGVAARAAFAIGYRRICTYLRAEESGVSLKAAGWTPVAEVHGRSWSCPARPRPDSPPAVRKRRYERLAPASSAPRPRLRSFGDELVQPSLELFGSVA
jgi:hypothetical protein